MPEVVRAEVCFEPVGGASPRAACDPGVADEDVETGVGLKETGGELADRGEIGVAGEYGEGQQADCADTGGGLPVWPCRQYRSSASGVATTPYSP